MKTYYAISDMMVVNHNGSTIYVTGWWDGQEMVESVMETKFFHSIVACERVLGDGRNKGKFTDPIVHEIELRVGESHDMAQKYGAFSNLEEDG